MALAWSRAVGTLAVAPGGADLQHKAARCQELEAHHDWQGLRDCAAELADVGAHDRAVQARAEELWRTAVKEAPNAVVADKVQAALRAGNLREAWNQLKILKPDSVYWEPTRSALHSAEQEAFRDIWRKAQVLAGIHDCAALQRLQAQVSASSTPEIAAALARVTCSHRVQPPCDTLTAEDIEGLTEQAEGQLAAGFAKPALVLMTKALGCKQDTRLFRMAAMRACAAHDSIYAQVYFDRSQNSFRPRSSSAASKTTSTCRPPTPHRRSSAPARRGPSRTSSHSRRIGSPPALPRPRSG